MQHLDTSAIRFDSSAMEDLKQKAMFPYVGYYAK